MTAAGPSGGRAAAALLSGTALALCLPKPGLNFLGWFALAPLFAALDEASARRGAVLGFLAGFAYHATALNWIYWTCRFAHVSRFVGLVALFALAAFLALSWATIGLFGSWALRGLPLWLKPWSWAAAWTAMSYLWNSRTPRLAADFLAYSQWRHPALFQMDAILGPYGLGAIILAINAGLGILWNHARRRGGARWGSLLATTLGPAVIFLALGAFWGQSQLARRDRFLTSKPSLTATAVILQPDIDQYHKWDDAYRKENARILASLVSQAFALNPSLVLWPESSIPFAVDETIGRLDLPHTGRGRGQRPSALRAVGKGFGPAGRGSRSKGDQLVGAISYLQDSDGVEFYNAALLVSPAGSVVGRYHKRRLVPFGEFVPLKFLKRFIGILNTFGDLTPGERDQPLLKTAVGLVAVTICYEAAFPELARFDAARGARIIANLTNDGWYKDSWGPYQHFGTNVFRAVENRVYVLRSANTGISAAIDPWGLPMARLGLGQRGDISAEIPAADPFPARSFYARHGDWLAGLCLLAAAGFGLMNAVRSRA